MDFGYTIVGYYAATLDSDDPYNILLGRLSPSSCYPIFLPNRKISKFRGVSDINEMFTFFRAPVDMTNYISGSFKGHTGVQVLNISLQALYQLKWVHGELDLFKLFTTNGFYIQLLDENENDYFPYRYRFGHPQNNDKWLDENEIWDTKTASVIKVKSHREIIIEVEQKYPGLFKPILVNPKIQNNSSPKIVVSNKSKKKSKPPRDIALTKKYRNQRSKQTFPDWWEVKSE
jgi:hypothetical protein